MGTARRQRRSCWPTGARSRRPRRGSWAVAAQRAGKLPLSDYAISQAARSQQQAASAANERAIAQHPAIATYRNISPKARKAALLDDWERRNVRLKQMAPSVYAERRKQYSESLP